MSTENRVIIVQIKLYYFARNVNECALRMVSIQLSLVRESTNAIMLGVISSS